MPVVFVAMHVQKKKKKKKKKKATTTFHKPAYELLPFKGSANLQQSLSQG
jgi:hypothetical protein